MKGVEVNNSSFLYKRFIHAATVSQSAQRQAHNSWVAVQI
jgi:hypothetical protein